MSPKEQLADSEIRASRPVPATAAAETTIVPDRSRPRQIEGPQIVSLPRTNHSKLREAENKRDVSPRSLGGRRFARDGPGPRSASQSPFRLSMPSVSPGQLAFSAMQYLPVPIIVLNSLKTVVLANESMGRMLGLVQDESSEGDPSATIERLRGQTLSQVGIDMLQEGRPVWVTWDVFLDSLVSEMGVRAPARDSRQMSHQGSDATLTQDSANATHRRASSTRPTQDAVVEVVISRKDINKTNYDSRLKSRESEYQAQAKMIISIWEIEDRQTYFTLTFTSTRSSPSSLANTKKSVARSSVLEAAERKTIAHSTPSSVPSSRDSSSPSLQSPSVITMSTTPFPPLGPPSTAAQSGTPSLLQKNMLMKDALLDNAQMPVLAMWKDGSVTFPNKAARSYYNEEEVDTSVDGFELLRKWDMWNEDFTKKLTRDEYPISRLIRNEEPFTSMRVGVYGQDGSQVLYDVSGEAIRDSNTGEFLGGIVTGRDVTIMTQEISQIKERDEERFRLVCDTMPQLVWTAAPDGTYDFFNTRWFDYTGLRPEECLSLGWQSLFHPDDVPKTLVRWNESLRTGRPFWTEYRCRGKDGDWRWYLGRALPVRNKETGEIEKWFGTCTDVHESTATKLNAERTRQQLLNVIAHSQVTIFTVDLRHRITMLEGALIWNNSYEENHESRWFIGENMYDVFNRLTEHSMEDDVLEWIKPVENVLGEKSEGELMDHAFNNRWYRTRFLPMYGKRTRNGKATDESVIEGVIGLIMDTTELKSREEALQRQSKEKRKAIAAEAAAKEATRLKSQFLANMSHEIRTPITGVLGMAELLCGMPLDDEQKEYVDNIQSSATSLLTVINDILDFSKVESGRLDIEEVQFSLSLIVKEVGRMLRFAVERKNLDFRSDIGGEIENDLVVIGDPGRVRQIITNLLTNSIKFTNQGYVRFSVVKEKETPDSVEVKFVVEDTGIGIQEDVRKKLFQPFSQGDASTARRFGGTGLGLTICKNLLDLMHGRISLDSSIGNGTRVTFWIPFSKPHGSRVKSLAGAGAIPDRLQSELSLSCNSSEIEHLAGHAQSIDSAPFATTIPRRQLSLRSTSVAEQDLSKAERAKIQVLVVEDNPVNQKIATKTIGRLGFQVTAAWNGREALDYLMGVAQGQNPKPDIILMDVQMPVIDGYKCTHLLRHHLPYKTLVQDVPIVAMTASAIQGDREKCTKAGMDDYLSKPVTMSILEKMLIRWAVSKRRGYVPSDRSTSDCSEHGENCGNADIPQVGIEDFDGDASDKQADGSLVTPRPLTSNGHQTEPSPFDAQASTELAAQQVRSSEGETELSSMLQETKLMDAAGGPSMYRNNSFQEQKGGEMLTEENMNKFKLEN